MSGNGRGNGQRRQNKEDKIFTIPCRGDAWPDPVKSHSEKAAVARKRRGGRAGERPAENQELGRDVQEGLLLSTKNSLVLTPTRCSVHT